MLLNGFFIKHFKLKKIVKILIYYSKKSRKIPKTLLTLKIFSKPSNSIFSHFNKNKSQQEIQLNSLSLSFHTFFSSSFTFSLSSFSLSLMWQVCVEEINKKNDKLLSGRSDMRISRYLLEYDDLFPNWTLSIEVDDGRRDESLIKFHFCLSSVEGNCNLPKNSIIFGFPAAFCCYWIQ